MLTVTSVFADVGVIAAEDGQLADALALLAARLDLAGCGDLLTQLTNLTCWADVHGDVPGCRCGKKPPDPKPIQPPKPPPPPKVTVVAP